jgi:hypothetical protein
MRTDSRLLLLLPLLLLISCAERAQMPGKGFEGKIVQKISVGGDFMSAMKGHDSTDVTGAGAQAASNETRPAMEITMYSKGDKLAYDLSMMGFPIKLHTIIDRSTRTIALVTPDKMAYVSDIRSIDKVRETIDDSLEKHHSILDSLSAHMPKPTGQKKTINGLACEEYTTKLGDNDVTFWMTQDPRLKFYDILRDAFLGKQRTGLGGMEEAMAILAPIVGDGHVPVLTELRKNGKILLKSELVTLSEEKVDDDIVTIPADYKIVKQDLDLKPKSEEKGSEKK